LFQLSFLLRNQDPKGQLEHRESDKLGEKFVASAKVWLAPSSNRFKCSIGPGINADMGVVPLIEMLAILSIACMLVALFALAMDGNRLIARDLPIA